MRERWLSLRIGYLVGWALVILLLPFPAVASGQSAGRDSSGVRIVENRVPTWANGKGWRVASEPSVRIGAADSVPEVEFGRVTSVQRLADKSIVVADAHIGQLRFYDAEGRYQRTVGRRGRGPGDYISPVLLPNYADDSIIVYDPDATRISVLDSAGKFGRVVRLAPALRGGMVLRGKALGRMRDGSFLVQETGLLTPSAAGLHRGSVAYVRYGTDGVVDTLGSFAGAEVLVSTYGAGLVFSALPFLQTAHAVADRDRFYYGDTESYAIGAYTLQGKLARIVKGPHAADELRRSEYDQWVASQLGTIRDTHAREETATFYARLFKPWRLPAFGELLVDADRNLWVAEYRSSSPDYAPAWDVFTAEGKYLGSVLMPHRFTPMEIGSDYVIGVRLDDMDVSYIELYGLTRSSR